MLDVDRQKERFDVDIPNTHRMDVNDARKLAQLRLGSQSGDDGAEALRVGGVGDDVYAIPRLILHHLHVELQRGLLRSTITRREDNTVFETGQKEGEGHAHEKGTKGARERDKW